MTEKTAVVHWEGQGKKGQGKISTETGALKQYPYGFASRFEDDRRRPVLPPQSQDSDIPRRADESSLLWIRTMYYPPSVWSCFLYQVSACAKCCGSKSGQNSSLT